MNKPKKKPTCLDNLPWYINHPSPMAKWFHNLSMLGFEWFSHETAGLIWWFFLIQ